MVPTVAAAGCCELLMLGVAGVIETGSAASADVTVLLLESPL
jgi:hypothetical protein